MGVFCGFIAGCIKKKKGLWVLLEIKSSNQPCSISVSEKRAIFRGCIIVPCVEIGVRNHIDEANSFGCVGFKG